MLEVSHKKVFQDWYKKEHAFLSAFHMGYFYWYISAHWLRRYITCNTLGARFFYLGTIDILCWIIFVCVHGGVGEHMCIVKFLAAFQASTHRCQCHHHLQLWQLKWSPNIVKCPLGSKIAPSWGLYWLRERNTIISFFVSLDFAIFCHSQECLTLLRKILQNFNFSSRKTQFLP